MATSESTAAAAKRPERTANRLYSLVDLAFNPEPVRIYKPQQNGQGTALSMDLRLDLIFGPGFVDQRESSGGLFLVMAPQSGVNTAGNATFDWPSQDNPKPGISAKLGTTDISSLLVGIRYARIRHELIPESLRPKTDTVGNTVGLFHSFGEGAKRSTTAITLQFAADGSFLKISKSKDLQRSIKLSLTEEFQFERALEHALKMFQLVGW